MRSADLIFHGGAVRAMVRGAPVDAIAVIDGVIAVVDADEVRELRGPGTEVVDIGGGALLQGFQDAPARPIDGGLQRVGCDMVDVRGLDEYRAVTARFAAQPPTGIDVAHVDAQTAIAGLKGPAVGGR